VTLLQKLAKTGKHGIATLENLGMERKWQRI